MQIVCRAVQMIIDEKNQQALVGMGTIYLHQRRHEEAIEALTKATEVGAVTGEVWRYLGRAYESAGNWDKACEFHQKATEASPDSPEVWQSLAAVYQRMGQQDKASNAMRRALALSGH